MINWIKKILGIKELPIWSYGLECDICKKTFLNARVHNQYVHKKLTTKKHTGKIPVLRSD